MLNLRIKDLDKIAKYYFNFVSYEYETHEFLGEKRPPWDLVNSWTLKNLNMTFKQVILADFKRLKRIKKILDNRKNKTYPYYILDLISTYDHFSKKRRGLGCSVSKYRWSAFDLIEIMGKVVCPYCNIIEITNLPNSKNRFAEMDHFFNKDTYPILGLSFYNLVPACHYCNLRKKKKPISASPYDHPRSISEFSTFSWFGNPNKKDSLVALFESRGVMKSNEDAFKINDHYSLKIDTLYNLLQKMQASSIAEIKSSYEKSRPGYTSYKKALEIHFNTIWEEEELYQKEFAKFMKDLIKDAYEI